ncbi:DUF2065 domain-containing protein [Devosia algicola]|uniref:DUF2065 domain-containing protein n=1 Tax=Devosia algicola TaxID=3026418 RepID=A0ABY7YRC9_9HYPH|nr:DUF2065 domain-containing protein [Devosia algicola]WDR03814.1 DUF2065 domain-containing protein [Devosia algicola]
MNDLFAALALAITLEGLLYAAFPEQMKRALAGLLALPVPQLRLVALSAAALGLVLLWVVRALP